MYAEGCDDSRPVPLVYHALIVVPRRDNLANIIVHHDISLEIGRVTHVVDQVMI